MAKSILQISLITEFQFIIHSVEMFRSIQYIKYSVLDFLAHLALPKWAYIIMIHEMDPNMGLWFRLCGICVICVCSSWPEYKLHKLHILQIYHIIPLVNAHDQFSQYHVYFSAGSHFAQTLKMALLSLSLNLGAPYCTQS